MRKISAVLSALLLTLAVQAQTDSTVKNPAAPIPPIKEKVSKPKKDWSKVKLANRANDHFMFQFGYDTWTQVPDSIRLTGIGRHLNIYLMMDFPFKVDPRFSVGIGVGIGSSNIFFDKHDVQIAGNSPTLAFRNLADTNHFKKYKLVNVWAEVPVELRFAANPENTNKSWKFAVGAKVGTMLNAHTKGKNFQTKSGSAINNYTEKINSRRYFNALRIAATARISYGPFGIFGSYQVNTLIKDNQGPPVHPMSVGLTISGL